MDIRFVNKSLRIDIKNDALPHWQQGDSVVFLTIRLADSLPQSKLAEYRETLDDLMKNEDESQIKALREEFEEKVNKWLDAGLGSCILRNVDVRKIVEDSLTYLDGKFMLIHAYVIMPNHLHILFSPDDSQSIWDVFSRFKKFTAREINKLRNDSGTIWQKYGFDTLVRNWTSFKEKVVYIMQNPQYLASDEYTLYVSPQVLQEVFGRQ